MMAPLAGRAVDFPTWGGAALERDYSAPPGTKPGGHLIYCANAPGVYRYDLGLEGTRAVVLRHRAGPGIPRAERGARVRHVRLGDGAGTRADRQDGVEDRLVAQGWALHRANQGQSARGGGHRRGGQGGREAGSPLKAAGAIE